jgi:hypothetical protein
MREELPDMENEEIVIATAALQGLLASGVRLSPEKAAEKAVLYAAALQDALGWSRQRRRWAWEAKAREAQKRGEEERKAKREAYLKEQEMKEAKEIFG